MAIINNRYELIRIIGKGGFGTTWYARDTKLDMPVAVKELSDTDPSRKAKFLREARTLARFAREPGIVNVRDYLEYNGKAYMVMEYLDGSDLNTKIAEGGPISFDAAYHLLQPVILVLGKLHAEGVIHRDVSPDNIRMQSDGTIKLLDFGAAWNTASTENATTTITVKPGYAPYEQYAGKERQGPFTDVYAVCATLYKCITGVTPPDALKRAFYDEIKAPSLLGAGITPAEEAVLMKGLAVNPPDRIQSMDELAQSLDRAKEGSSKRTPGAFKTTMSSAVAAGAINSSRMNASAGSTSEISSRTQDPSTQSYSSGNYTSQNQPAKDYAPQNNTAQGHSEQEHTSQGKPLQNHITQGQHEQGHASADTDRSAFGSSGNNEKDISGSAPVSSKRPDRNSAPESVDKPRRKGKSADSANTGKKRAGKPGKTLIALIALIAAAACVVFFIFHEGNKISGKTDSNKDTVHIQNTTVTAAQLQDIEKNENISILSIALCELSDAMVEELGRSTHIKSLFITACYGFTTLDPLANVPSLNRLEIDGQLDSDIVEGMTALNGSTLFTRDFPNITRLSIGGSVIHGGTDCLSHFPNLDSLSLNLWEPYSIAFLDNMPNLRFLNLSDSELDGRDMLDLSGEEAAHLYGHPQLEKLMANDTNLVDLGWAAECTNFQELSAANCLISDLTPLADHKKLQKLSLNNNKIESLLPLSGCDTLTYMYLSGNPLTDLNGLEGHEKLRILKINNTSVSSLLPLTECTGLSEFSCQNTQISSLQGLESCPLTDLYADGNAIADLSPLSANDTMVHMTVSDNLLESLNGCEQMIHLKEFKAARNALSEIKGITNSSGIEELDLRSNRITDISPLQNAFTALKNLNISNNQISSITPLSGCTALEILNADYNEIQSLSPLEGCSKLTAVLVGNNALTNLTGLSGKPGLYALLADHNKIQNIDGIKGSIKTLHYLDIGCNKVTDISPLTELSEKKVVILAERNSFSDLSPLPEGLRYNALVFYGNPISDFTKLTELRDINSISDKLYISWNENADMKQLGMTPFSREMHIVAPLDKRAAIEVAVKEGYDENKAANIPITPIYLSDEEADAEAAAWREDVRKEVNGEKETESESDESTAESGAASASEDSSSESTSS